MMATNPKPKAAAQPAATNPKPKAAAQPAATKVSNAPLNAAEMKQFKSLVSLIEAAPAVGVPSGTVEIPTPNLNPFGEAVGFTEDVENITPSLAVMDVATANATIKAMHDSLNSGNIAAIRNILHTTAPFLSTIKGLLLA